MKAKVAWIAILLFSLMTPFMDASAELQVLRVSPSGENAHLDSEINITFSEDMTELGKMELSVVPDIQITPKIMCEWRWLDLRNLVCSPERHSKLLAASEYTVTIGTGISSHAKEKLKAPYTAKFTTIRPRIINSYQLGLQEWNSPVRPKSYLTANMDISSVSLRKNLELRLKSDPKKTYKFSLQKDLNYQNRWTLEPSEDLPREAEYTIFVKKGLATDGLGNLTSINDFSRDEKTAPYFRIEQVECVQSETAQSGYNSNDYGDYGYDEDYNQGRNNFNFIEHSIDEIKKANEQGKPFLSCLPHRPKYLRFSIPVIPESVYKQITIAPNPAGDSGVDPFSDASNYSMKYFSTKIELPKVLRAKTLYEFDLSQIRNVFDEPLEGVQKMALEFLPRSPMLKILHTDAVIESQIETDVPILVTNQDQIKVKYNTWSAKGIQENQEKTYQIEKLEDASYYYPLGVKELLGMQSGLVEYGLEAKNYSKVGSFFAAQVTPYQVTLKLGHYNSLVWVMDLSTGRPVSAAKIELLKRSGTNILKSSVQTNNDGLASFEGFISLDKTIVNALSSHNRTDFYLKVQKGDDVAFLPLRPSYYSVNDHSYYRTVYNYARPEFGHLKIWGTTPQGIYKLGSTIDYKIYVRDDLNKSLAIANPNLSYNLTVTDPTGKIVHKEENLKLSVYGTHSGKFKVPEGGSVGHYYFQVKVDAVKDASFHPMSVLVTDFTPAPFQVSITSPKTQIKKNESVMLTASAKLHSGANYGEAPARFTVDYLERPFRPTNKLYKDFSFTSSYGWTQRIDQTMDKTNSNGESTYNLTGKASSNYGFYFVEAAVQDERGKFHTSTTKIEFFGTQEFLGSKMSKWSYKVGEKAKVEAVILDTDSEAVVDRDIKMNLYYWQIKAVKTKGAGNAFVTRYDQKRILEESCSIKTINEASACEFKVANPGRYEVGIIRNGNYEENRHTFYATGKGQLTWADTEKSNNLTLMTSSNEVKVDEEAEVLIQNPFPNAKALVTIERYGIIESWVEDVDSSAYLLKFKVKPEYLPGFYLSVDLFSARVAEAKGLRELDLGKPSYRNGYLRFMVNDPYKKIELTAKPSKEVYFPRDEVRLDITASSPNKKLGDTEVAVAILDESVFDLIKDGEKYFDPYLGLMKLDSLDVFNFSLIRQLIGRQKFEKKGANQGGDGQGMTRSRIDYLAYWNPSVILKNGKASVSFKLPDNLTGWKVLMMGADKEDRMGLGTSKFVSRTPTEIRAALPNQVVEGDEFIARFTVYNQEDYTRKIKTSISASGSNGKLSLNKNVVLEIPAKGRKNIELKIAVPKVSSLTADNEYVSFIVKAEDKVYKDTLIKKLQIIPYRPSYWAAQYDTLEKDGTRDIPVKFPASAIEGIGGLKVMGTTTKLGQLTEGFSYMAKYPYECWEQKISKAMAAAQYYQLKDRVTEKVEFPMGDKLPQATLDLMSKYQLDDGSMSYYGKYTSAYLSAYTAILLTKFKKYGYNVDSERFEKLINYLRYILAERAGFDQGIQNDSVIDSIRMIALYALTLNDKLADDDVDRFMPLTHQLEPLGLFYLFEAALSRTGEEENAKKVLTQVMSRISISEGSARFNMEYNDSIWAYIHSSSRRTQCQALSTILAAKKRDRFQKELGDLAPKMMRTISKDMNTMGVFWNTTQNTIFCLDAIIDYISVYEKDVPDLKFAASFGSQSLGEKEIKGFSEKPVELNYVLAKEALGKEVKLSLSKKGTGTLYTKTLLSYSDPNQNKELNHGMTLTKHVSIKSGKKWKALAENQELNRGDVLSVDLILHVPTLRHFVVVDDPIPGSFEPINTQLATASQMDAREHSNSIDVIKDLNIDDLRYFGFNYDGFYHRELRHDRAVFYSRVVPKGTYLLNYRVQVVGAGKFHSAAAKAQEMYDPEIYGSSKSAIYQVKE